MDPMTLAAMGLLLVPDAYPQLPSERACELMHQVAVDDLWSIDRQRNIAEGWTRQQLGELRDEAERVREIYWACWWLTWTPPGHPWKQTSRDQLDCWEDRLLLLAGPAALYRGEIPLPLSLR
jgi:hypothetical protein